jgi:crotonobetainyl-CoA:carnitine CoA-transferase CaiB-like acyl-CoA transferase
METQPHRGPLTGIRVIELADEQAEYCGLTLAGLGADVVKVEPPGGNATRRIGPFYQDREDPERSLFFWQYNRGKRSIVLDLRQPTTASASARCRHRRRAAGVDAARRARWLRARRRALMQPVPR